MGRITRCLFLFLLASAIGSVANSARATTYSLDANGASPATGDFGVTNNWNPNTAPEPVDSKTGKPVFSRTATHRDTWSTEAAKYQRGVCMSPARTNPCVSKLRYRLG